MTEMTWGEFLAGAELAELKLGGVYGILADLRPADGEALPEEWELNFQHAFRAEGDTMSVRVIATASGPGGELVVDGLGVFEFAFPLEEAPREHVERFYEQTAVAAVIPTVRASFNDLNMRMELGAPPIGIVKYAPEPEAVEDSPI